MVKVVKGVLIECDATMKQFLLHLDDINGLGDKFILEDLSDTTIFIDSNFVNKLKEKIDDLMEKLSYTPDK